MRGWNYRTVTLAERVALLACGLCLGTAWAAEEPPDAEAVSDVEFIEYLGLWAGSDDEWLIYNRDVADGPRRASAKGGQPASAVASLGGPPTFGADVDVPLERAFVLFAGVRCVDDPDGSIRQVDAGIDHRRAHIQGECQYHADSTDEQGQIDDEHLAQ